MSIEFPTLVYRTPGTHQCPGGTYAYQSAQDAEQLDGLLEDGWFLSLPEALAGKHDEERFSGNKKSEPEQRDPSAKEWLLAKAKEVNLEPDDNLSAEELLFLICHAFAAKPEDAEEDNKPPTREELEAKAKELGITFDGRTTDKSLTEKIEHVLAEQSQE